MNNRSHNNKAQTKQLEDLDCWADQVHLHNQKFHPQAQPDIRADRISERNLEISELVNTFKFEKSFELTTVNISRYSTDNTTIEDISYTLYI
jgi:hypothetical protein